MAGTAPWRGTEFTLRGPLPGEVNVSVRREVEFTVTLPKSRLVALTVNCGFGVAVPFPVRATIIVPLFDELVVMAMVPLAAEAVAGRKLTWMVSDWPEFSVAGNDALEIANPAPETVTDLTVNGASPDEVIVRVLVAVVFTVTSPKSRLLEVAATLRLPAELRTMPLHPQTIHNRETAAEARRLRRRLSHAVRRGVSGL